MSDVDVTTTGRVLSGTGGVWSVLRMDGETCAASLRGRVKHASDQKLAVGDEVRLERGADGQWSIIEIAPRTSQLARRNPSGARGERVVVANLDQVVIVVAAARPEPNERMLDRFLVIAEANDVAARIVINKIDLVDPRAARARFAPYEAMGYDVLYTSSITGEGLRELGALLRGRTSALTGPSGVGKSSLLNALYPALQLRVGAISESVNKGRHTTVGARLCPLPEGGFVADTPGLREVGLWALPTESLAPCFPEMQAVGPCRFGDCLHRAEPGCQVRAAVEAGAVSRARYESYCHLLEETERAERQRLDGGAAAE